MILTEHRMINSCAFVSETMWNLAVDDQNANGPNGKRFKDRNVLFSSANFTYPVDAKTPCTCQSDEEWTCKFNSDAFTTVF